VLALGLLVAPLALGIGAAAVSAGASTEARGQFALGLAIGGAFATGAAQPVMLAGGAPPTINADAANAYG
jgi:hypothetical protein